MNSNSQFLISLGNKVEFVSIVICQQSKYHELKVRRGGRELNASNTTQLVPRGGWIKLVATVSSQTLNVMKNGILVANIHDTRAVSKIL